MVCASFDFLDKNITVNGLSDDHIFKIISQNNCFYEQDLLNLIAIFPFKNGIFLDIGANIGNHTLFFAKILGKNVISVEPNPITMEFLVKNIASNNLDKNVTLYDKPIGENLSDLYDSICVSDVNLGMHKFTKTDAQNSKITGETIDNIAQDNQVSLIKIDVEGAELSALKGAFHTLSTYKPILVIEAANVLEKKNIIGHLTSFGYHLISIKCATDTLLFVHQDDNLSIYKSIVETYDYSVFNKTINRTLKGINRTYTNYHSEVTLAVDAINQEIYKFGDLIQESNNHKDIYDKTVETLERNNNVYLQEIEQLKNKLDFVFASITQEISDTGHLIRSKNNHDDAYNKVIKLLENNNNAYVKEIENLKNENALIRQENIFYSKKSDILEKKVEFLFGRIKKINPIASLFFESFSIYKEKLNKKLNSLFPENKKKRKKLIT